jgi:hypothetical protein
MHQKQLSNGLSRALTAMRAAAATGILRAAATSSDILALLHALCRYSMQDSSSIALAV